MWQILLQFWVSEEAQADPKGVLFTVFKLRMTVHTGHKTYPCKQCSQSFTQSGDHMRHLLVNTGNKPYPYQQCAQSLPRTMEWPSGAFVTDSVTQYNPFSSHFLYQGRVTN